MAAGRSRRIAVGTASVAVHLALLAVVALQAPRLVVPPGASGPPEAVIPILILPRVPPPATAAPGTAPQPQEIRLHRRKQAFSNEPPPIAPLVAPSAPAPKPAPPPIGPRVLNLPSPEDAVATNARNALRGTLGCANANLVGLSREERQKCEDQLAAGAKLAPYLAPAIDADKAKGLAAAAARREADYHYKREIKPSQPASGQVPWDKYRGPPGQAEAMGAATGNDRPSLTVPF